MAQGRWPSFIPTCSCCLDVTQAKPAKTKKKKRGEKKGTKPKTELSIACLFFST